MKNAVLIIQTRQTRSALERQNKKLQHRFNDDSISLVHLKSYAHVPLGATFIPGLVSRWLTRLVKFACTAYACNAPETSHCAVSLTKAMCTVSFPSRVELAWECYDCVYALKETLGFGLENAITKSHFPQFPSIDFNFLCFSVVSGGDLSPPSKSGRLTMYKHYPEHGVPVKIVYAAVTV